MHVIHGSTAKSNHCNHPNHLHQTIFLKFDFPKSLDWKDSCGPLYSEAQATDNSKAF